MVTTINGRIIAGRAARHASVCSPWWSGGVLAVLGRIGCLQGGAFDQKSEWAHSPWRGRSAAGAAGARHCGRGQRQVHADLASREGAAPSGLAPQQVQQARGGDTPWVGGGEPGAGAGRGRAYCHGLWVPAPKQACWVLLFFVLVFHISGF